MAAIDGRMALCPVDQMNDVPMISALHNECALLWLMRGCHPIIFHPNNRATGQRSIRMGPDGCLCMAETDGRMAVCPVDPMVDAPMMNAMPRNCALQRRLFTPRLHYSHLRFSMAAKRKDFPQT